jgi:hypothetical protein
MGDRRSPLRNGSRHTVNASTRLRRASASVANSRTARLRTLHRVRRFFAGFAVTARLFQPQDQSRHLACQRLRLLDEVLDEGCE